VCLCVREQQKVLPEASELQSSPPMSLNHDLFSATEDSNNDDNTPSSPPQPNSLLSEELIQQQQEDEENENMIDYETVDSVLSSSTTSPRNNDSNSTSIQQNSNALSKERFIDILARDEDEPDEIHTNDYNFILSALVITTEPTLAKLACQAIDKVSIAAPPSLPYQ
jgi:hypothetical protein